MRNGIGAIITFLLLLSIPAAAQSNDPLSTWIAGIEKKIEVKVGGIKVLKTQRELACSRESQLDKDACRDSYNGIIKRAESEKGRLEAMVTKAKTPSERDQLVRENEEYNRENALTDKLYLAVVTAYPPVKQQNTTGKKN